MHFSIVDDQCCCVRLHAQKPLIQLRPILPLHSLVPMHLLPQCSFGTEKCKYDKNRGWILGNLS